MNRVWDYAGFSVWFMGLGYIVLRLVDAPQHRNLPPTLHVTGLAAATFVAVRLLLLAIARWRVTPQASALPPASPAKELLPERAPQPALRLPTVKPRSHFGLRGKRD
ncbi:MAG TPA: hypothetical protein VFA57_14775 [Pseudolabrys sp.]|nr:hypothetical protein [Pseudolabrys sp.]